ncbi:MAG: hypothetical protein E6G76_13235 [Alphaproteobacteria bacterium]|nr:MAG: hypothetical protein E6G76_13235 [Alphaproteobacteria bacterium]
MHVQRNVAAIVVVMTVACAGSSIVRAAGCEGLASRHMVAEALLAAHLVASAEMAGMKKNDIDAILKNVAEKSVAQEF